MEKYYTVTSAKRLDGQDNYGNVTDSCFFDGETNSALFKHAPTTSVEKGGVFYGKIEELPTKAGGTYRKFSRATPPEDEGAATSTGDAVFTPRNGGDGARQGMAINNAATFVIQHAPADIDPKSLAEEIKRFAKEIYAIDLSTTEQDILAMMSE